MYGSMQFIIIKMSVTSKEKWYCTVNIVRKLISHRVGKLHELLDERKQVLIEELDKLELNFKIEKQKNENELNEFTAHQEKSLEILNGYLYADNATQPINTESNYNLDKNMEIFRVRLGWDDERVKRELSLLGVLETPKQDQLEPGPDQPDVAGNYELIDHYSPAYQTYRSDTMDRDRKRDYIFGDPVEDYEEIPYQQMGVQQKRISQPINSTSNDDLTLNKTINRKSLDLPQILQKGKYVINSKALKQGVGNLVQMMKVSNSSTWLEGLISDSENKPHSNPTGQIPSFQSHILHKSQSADDVTKEEMYQTPAEDNYTVINKCTMGKGPGQLLKPKNVAVSTKTGCIFVAEKGNNRVQVFTKTGDPLFSFGQRTKGLSMKQPYGVCILNEKVYVSQSESNCVMVFKTNGDYCMQGGQQGKSDGCFNFPAGLCTDGTNLLVCDFGNNRVQVLTKNLIFRQMVGVWRLKKPTDIAIDPSSSNIVVLDCSNIIVHIFNSKGVLQRKIINVTHFPNLSEPLFLTISPRGNIVLSDLLTCSVNLFNMEGQLLWTLGGIQNKDTFGEPRGVTCDMMGRLVVVCNKDHGCLKIIQIHLPSLF